MAHQVQTYSRAANLAQDALSSIKTVHAFGAGPRLVKWYDEYFKKSVILGVLFASQPFLVMAGTALSFWEGYRLFQHGEVGNVGTVFTAVLSVTLGATSVLLFLPQLNPITNAASAASELFTIMDKPSILILFLQEASSLPVPKEILNCGTCTLRIHHDPPSLFFKA